MISTEIPLNSLSGVATATRARCAIKLLPHESMGPDWPGRYDLEGKARATCSAAGDTRESFKGSLARKPAR